MNDWKQQGVGLPVRWALLCLLAMNVAFSATGQSNVVVIISDDAGWADFGFLRAGTSDADPGSAGSVPTPNLDILAGMGVSFTNAYAGSVCAPSRAMLVSGQYGGRFGYHQNMTTNNTQPIDQVVVSQGVPSEIDTIWERMQAEGYNTSASVSYTHLVWTAHRRSACVWMRMPILQTGSFKVA